MMAQVPRSLPPAWETQMELLVPWPSPGCFSYVGWSGGTEPVYGKALFLFPSLPFSVTAFQINLKQTNKQKKLSKFLVSALFPHHHLPLPGENCPGRGWGVS